MRDGEMKIKSNLSTYMTFLCYHSCVSLKKSYIYDYATYYSNKKT